MAMFNSYVSLPEGIFPIHRFARHALFFAQDVATLRALAEVGSLSSTDSAGRSILWHATASNRTETGLHLARDHFFLGLKMFEYV